MADLPVAMHVAAVAAPPSRTATIMDAIRQQLVQRRALIDQATDLGEITVTVRLQAGTTWVRGVQWSEERVMRQSARNGEVT